MKMNSIPKNSKKQSSMVAITKGNPKPPIAGDVFVETMTAMKNILSHAEDRYDGDVNDKGYKWYRSFVMDQFFPMLERQMELLEKVGIVEQCECGASIKNRNGYRTCMHCRGCGYRNTQEINDFIFDVMECGLGNSK
jgi:hypothetical protein